MTPRKKSTTAANAQVDSFASSRSVRAIRRSPEAGVIAASARSKAIGREATQTTEMDREHAIVVRDVVTTRCESGDSTGDSKRRFALVVAH